MIGCSLACTSALVWRDVGYHRLLHGLHPSRVPMLLACFGLYEG